MKLRAFFTTSLFLSYLAFSFLPLPLAWGAAENADRAKTALAIQEVNRALRHSIMLTHESPDMAILEGAIRGMTWVLDKHTNYFSLQEAKDFMAMIKGGFGGIGMTFGMRNDRYTVMSVIPNNPAEKAGLLAGDRIFKINGEATLKMAQNDVMHKIRGQEGTSLTLTILRESPTDQTLEIPLVRGLIKIESIKYHVIKDIGFIRINDFSETGGQEFVKAVEAVQKQGVVGLVLDLRNNPGGSLKAAVEIAGVFLKQGQPVVSVEGRNSRDDTVLTAPSSETSSSLPLVVLINGGSASASEVVTGALQDYGRAIVMGSQSYGKASVQRTYPITNEGDMIKITGQHYFTPKHRLIHGVGLTPDVLEEGETVASLMSDLSYRECFEKIAKAFLKTNPEVKEDALEVPDFLLAQLMENGLRSGILLDKADIEREKIWLKRYLRVEVARAAFGELAAAKQSVKEDAMVQHAMELLHVLQTLPPASAIPKSSP